MFLNARLSIGAGRDRPRLINQFGTEAGCLPRGLVVRCEHGTGVPTFFLTIFWVGTPYP